MKDMSRQAQSLNKSLLHRVKAWLRCRQTKSWKEAPQKMTLGTIGQEFLPEGSLESGLAVIEVSICLNILLKNDFNSIVKSVHV